LSRPRGVVVVTGSELVRGERTDRNGPFLAEELLRLGVEPARIQIVGDDADELEAALREGLEADLCVVSGGLGPTHDDRTVELLAKAAGRELSVDPGLEAQIGAVSRGFAERMKRPYEDFEAGVRKQATLPDGAIVIGVAGTAPGLVLDGGSSAVVVLPGPPPELRRLWPDAVASAPVQAVLARARVPARSVLRFYGVSESTVARALEEAGGESEGLRATICARDYEIHVDLLADEEGLAQAAALTDELRERLGRHLFAEDERPVEELVLAACRERGLSLAAAESCTGGLVASRLTAVAGASDVFRGGVVAYSNEVKSSELGVSEALLTSFGAVSAEVAAAMADGIRRQLESDVAVSVTGIAGPGGGTADKPVGLVHLHVVGPDGGRGVELNLPGGRDAVRGRATAAALHSLLRLLAQNRHEDA
jgi:nicotinamide-nucleotide amidase